MENKTVKPNNIIELKYTLREGSEKGPVIEIMDENWPLKFLYGSGAMLKAFEENLLNLPEGAKFEFTLYPEDAYGMADPNKNIQLFTDELINNERYPIENFEVGDYISVKTQKEEVLNGVLKEKNAHYIIIDCNHAMVGKTLHFSGQILFIKPASNEEISLNRYIEPNGFKSSFRFDDGL